MDQVRTRGRSWSVPWVPVLGAALVLALLAAAARSATVIDKGLLLPYTKGTIYQVEVWGVRFYLEPEAGPSSDWVVSAALFAVAGMAALTWGVIRRSISGRRSRFFLLVTLGAAFLGADELTGLHESIGHNMRFLADLPLVSRPDDLIMAGYALGAVVFMVGYRDILARHRPTLLWWVSAAVCVVLAVVSDLFSLPTEESFELVATACLVVGFRALAANWLRPAVGGDSPLT